ncbi:MAG TPA: cytochrome c-type biogenesis protein [Phenylobacterium sp.]|jgi:cytochrome c-type biogenesis protein CcmH
MRRRLALIVVTAAALAGPALAVTPDEQLADPKLEARARDVSQELRCVVCQNQSIDDSEAPLAHDLRVLLRERIAAGDTDAQAKAYLVQRYGSFVLLRPPFEPQTWALWLGPLLVLAIGGAGVAAYWREHRTPDGKNGQQALSAADEAELTRLMADEDS